jgi:hypothetical protein
MLVVLSLNRRYHGILPRRGSHCNLEVQVEVLETLPKRSQIITVTEKAKEVLKAK